MYQISYNKSLKLFFERFMLYVIIVNLVIIIFHFFSGRLDQLWVKIGFLIVCALAYFLSRKNLEKIAYHLNFYLIIAFYIWSIWSGNNHRYSVILLGSTLALFIVAFFSNKRVQLAYLGIVVALESFIFYRLFTVDYLEVDTFFWPELIGALAHIFSVYLFSNFFLHRLRIANDDVDQVKKENGEINQSLRAQEKNLRNYIESNTNLESFASLASHELKSPLRIIKSFADLLVKRKDMLSPDQEKEYLTMISSKSEKMSILVDALYSLGSMAQTELNKSWIELNPFLTAIISEESSNYPMAQVDMLCELAEVYGDRVLLNRLFSNLLSNALKFSSTDNSRAQVVINCSERRDYACISISDNGIGIAEDKRKEVFELFNRQSNHIEFKGLGIGLALSKKIVDMHSGTIHILNSDLGGVCVEVRLPLS